MLRALCEISQSSFHHARFISNNRISIPLGLIVERWIYYYWSIVNTSLPLPEMRIGSRAKGMAFRSDLFGLIGSFQPGGLDAFFACFQNGTLNPMQIHYLTETVNSVANTIVKGPVEYSGGSLKDIERVFHFEGNKRMKQCLISTDLINSLGRVIFPASLWREMCLVGHLIGKAIILRWAELSYEFAKREVSIPEILALLIIPPKNERNVSLAKNVYKKVIGLTCVWSGIPLSQTRFDVDHVIPFSIWNNNDLWNLLPSDPKINHQKRDRIVTLPILRSSKDRIIHYWKILYQEAPQRFQTELRRTLLGSRPSLENWETRAFSTLSEAVETIALQRGVERWEIL